MIVRTKHTPRFNKPALAGIWYTLSSFLERGAAIIFTPIYTRLLLPEEYGMYSLYISFLGIATVFATLEISGNAVYRGLKEFDGSDIFISSAMGLILLSSTFSLAVYLLLSPFINITSSLSADLIIILFVQVFLNGVRALKISQAKFFYKHNLVFLEGLFFAIATPIISIILILFSNAPEFARIYGFLISAALFTVPIIFSILKKGNLKIYSKEIWIFLLKYSIPILPHYISIALIGQIGKIIVGMNFSAGEVALLSIAISVGFLPSLLSLGMQSAIIPWITRKLALGKGGIKRIYALTETVLFPLSIAVCLFLCICPEIFTVMASQSYASALNAVYPIAASVPICFISSLFSSIISYYKKTYLITIGSAIGAVFNLICNLLFTFRYGFVFSAILILPTWFIIFSIYSIILKIKFKHRPLSLKRLLILLSFFLLFVFFAFFLKVSLVARLILSAALIMLLIPEAKKLKLLISENKQS